MALFAVVFFSVALILIGIGLAIGLLACLLGAVLVGLGIVSVSVFAGVRSGRAETGIRTFFILSGAAVGIPAGAACAWLAESLFAEYGSGLPVLIYGAIGGAIGGLVVAMALDFTLRSIRRWATTRVRGN